MISIFVKLQHIRRTTGEQLDRISTGVHGLFLISSCFSVGGRVNEYFISYNQLDFSLSRTSATVSTSPRPGKKIRRVEGTYAAFVNDIGSVGD